MNEHATKAVGEVPTNQVTGTLFADDHKMRAQAWFAELRDRLCGRLEDLEDDAEAQDLNRDFAPAKFERTSWERDGGGGDCDGGSGSSECNATATAVSAAAVGVATAFVERASQPVLHELSSAWEMRMHESCAVRARSLGEIIIYIIVAVGRTFASCHGAKVCQ